MNSEKLKSPCFTNTKQKYMSSKCYEKPILKASQKSIAGIDKSKNNIPITYT